MRCIQCLLLSLMLPRGAGADPLRLGTPQSVAASRLRGMAFSDDSAVLTLDPWEGAPFAWRLSDQSVIPGISPPPQVRCATPSTGPWQMSRDCRAGVLEDEKSGRTRIWHRGMKERTIQLPPRTLVLSAFASQSVALATERTKPPIEPGSGRAQQRCQLLLVDANGTRWQRTLDGKRHALAISPDGSRVALALDDALLLFDGAEPRRLALPAPASALAFSPDGTRLAAGLDDNTALVFTVR